MLSKTQIGFALTALLLASCSRIGAGDFCTVARPIYVDRCADKLTEKTASQIDDHDTVGAKLCGWKKHAGAPCT